MKKLLKKINEWFVWLTSDAVLDAINNEGAHRMSLRHHSPHQILVFLQIAAYQEKCSRHLVLLQHIQNLSGMSVFIAGIEG